MEISWKVQRLDWSWWDLDCVDLRVMVLLKELTCLQITIYIYIYIYYIGCSSTTFWRSLYSLLYFSLCVTLTFTSVTVWWGIWEGSKMKATWPQNEPICVTLSPGVKVTRIPKSRRHKPQHIRATCEIIHTLLSNVIRYKILFDIIITYY